MSFPDHLANISVFKIHPAIGIARISNCDEHFVHGEIPERYMSKKRVKRQAVQFRIFAYDAGGACLGELTAERQAKLGLATTWTAAVGNRKIACLKRQGFDDHRYSLRASARSDHNGGALEASMAEWPGQTIGMGHITDRGLFIPPKGDVLRESPESRIKPYPARSQQVADTSSDGQIGVELRDRGGNILPQRVLPACIVVAPPDLSPDVNPADRGEGNLYEFLRKSLGIRGGAAPGDPTPHELDRAALLPCTQDFAPGYEVSLGGPEASDLGAMFYPPGADGVGPEEMRPKYRDAPNAQGAVLGQFTSGLCSTWQGDFTSCVGYWVENLPIEGVVLASNHAQNVNPYRYEYGDYAGRVDNLFERGDGEEYRKHVDECGVMRKDGDRLVETERDSDFFD